MLIKERMDGAYSNGYWLKLGKYSVFSIIWDGGRPPEGKPYKLGTSLPGFKSHLGHFESVELAEVYALSALMQWLKNSNLQMIPGGVDGVQVHNDE